MAQWRKAGKTGAEVTGLIYLSTLSRRPTDQKRQLVANFLKAAATPDTGFQDLQHAMMNLNEFLLRH